MSDPNRKEGKPSAKNIPTEEVLAFLDARRREKEARGQAGWTQIWELRRRFPEYSAKLLRAKIRRLKLNRLAEGCLCGCRGDFEITEYGRRRLQQGNWAPISLPIDHPGRVAEVLYFADSPLEDLDTLWLRFDAIRELGLEPTGSGHVPEAQRSWYRVMGNRLAASRSD